MLQPTTRFDTTRPRAIAIWLFVVAAMILAIVAVGGNTRLTESGLSITQWRHKKGHSEQVLTLSEHRKLLKRSGSSGWTRTSNPPVNSRMLAALRRENKKKD